VGSKIRGIYATALSQLCVDHNLAVVSLPVFLSATLTLITASS